MSNSPTTVTNFAGRTITTNNVPIMIAPTVEELDYLPDMCRNIEYVACTGYFFFPEMQFPCKVHESDIVESLQLALNDDAITVDQFWVYANLFMKVAEGWYFSRDFVVPMLGYELEIDLVAWMTLYGRCEPIFAHDFRAADGYSRFDPGLALNRELGLQFIRAVSPTPEDEAWFISMLSETGFFNGGYGESADV